MSGDEVAADRGAVETEAAVLRAVGEPLSVEPVQCARPRTGELRLRMLAAGICGSDAHVLEGRFPAPVPGVCGHEGVGVVDEVGPGVTGFAAGDTVLQVFVGSCGTCRSCRLGRRTFCQATPQAPDGSYTAGGFRLRDAAGRDLGTALGLGSFSGYTVTPARHCVVVPGDVDPTSLVLLSCGALTGVGAAVNIGRVQPGDAVAVVGVGGVGAAAILGAGVAGAATIVAVDVGDAKRAPALELGASSFVDATQTDVGEALAELTAGHGVDVVLLTAGTVTADQYRLAARALAPGGTVVQVGAAARDLRELPVDPRLLGTKQVSFTGTVAGTMDPPRDILRFVALHRAGRLPLERLVSRVYPLAEINTAFDDLTAGRNLRGVVAF
jgi:S-(hydroxymethyl)glutathione dehydrogenase/alcohol dehydrogenase